MTSFFSSYTDVESPSSCNSYKHQFSDMNQHTRHENPLISIVYLSSFSPTADTKCLRGGIFLIKRKILIFKEKFWIEKRRGSLERLHSKAIIASQKHRFSPPALGAISSLNFFSHSFVLLFCSEATERDGKTCLSIFSSAKMFSFTFCSSIQQFYVFFFCGKGFQMVGGKGGKKFKKLFVFKI